MNPAILTFIAGLTFEVQPGIPFGVFYVILARAGTSQGVNTLFLVLENAIMVTNVVFFV